MHRSSGQLPWPGRAVWRSALTALLVLLGSVVLISGTAPGSAPGAAVVALGSAGSVALVAAACAALGAVLVRVLVTGLPHGCALRRERACSGSTIVRAQEPGRPGRPQPRAPGAALLPSPVR